MISTQLMCGSHSKILFFLALVRLAWHSSGTYDKNTGTGGSGGGTIRFKEELAHGGNAGLGDTAVKWLEPIYAKYDGLSYADLYTLSGVAAIKAMNGPTIGWLVGALTSLLKL
jgi:cytochrome c peroxidase